MKMSLTKKQAKKFIKLQEMSDYAALEYYYKILEKVCEQVRERPQNRPHYLPAVYDCEMSVLTAAKELNGVIFCMEQGAIKHNGNIDTAYREIMMEFVESARKICEYEV